MDENGIKDQMFDKKDDEFIKITSTTYFFEIFSKKKIKCDVKIPQTIICDQGNLKYWFFNSQADRKPLIKMKNSNKLNIMSMTKAFARIKTDEDKLIMLKLQIKEIEKYKKPGVFLRFLNGSYNETSIYDLISMALEKIFNSVYIVQELLKFRSKSNEVYYAEYRRKQSTLPSLFKFFKKTIATKNQSEKKSQIDLENISGEALLEAAPPEEDNTSERRFFKCFDVTLNNMIQNATMKVVEFIEMVYRIKVRKIITKFIYDVNGELFFIGAKELRIELPENPPYKKDAVFQELQNYNFSFEKLIKLLKAHKIRPEKIEKQLSFSKIKNEERRAPIRTGALSAKLLSKLVVEQCKGDFCEYTVSESNQGVLSLRKNILEEYKRHFGENFARLNTSEITLPYEISNQLIIRVRECADDIIKLLRKNKIFSKNSTSKLYADQNFDEDKEYPFKNKKKDVENLQNLYKMIKICKNCFIVYALASRYFNSKHSTKAFATQQPALTSLPAQTTQQGRPRTDTIDSVSSLKEKGLASRAQTAEGGFRSKMMQGTGFSGKSGLISQAEFSTQGPERALTAKKNIKNKNDISLSRLTMGFLNYDKIKEFYQENTKKAVREPTEHFEVTPRNDKKIKLSGLNVSIFDALDLNPKIKINAFGNDEKTKSNIIEKPGQVNPILLKSLLNGEDINKYIPEKMLLVSYKRGEISLKNLRKLLYDQIKKRNQTKHKVSLSMFHGINTFNHLRKNFKFSLNTPLRPFSEEFSLSKIPSISFEKLCELGNYSPISKDDYTPQFKILIIDEYTAIPYAILTSNVYENNENCEIIVLFHDIFDSCLEYVSMIYEILENYDNKKFILFNFPGQAYTLYSDEKPYNNFSMANVVDSLLFRLEEQKQIDLGKNTFKFIGVGFGAYFLLTFITFSDASISKFNHLLTFNGFNCIDSAITNTLNKSLEIFLGCPEDNLELPFNFYSVITNSKEYTREEVVKKIKDNPIQLNGRICLIKSCLASHEIKDRVQRSPIRVHGVHSTKNCLISINHLEDLMRYETDERFIYGDARTSGVMAHWEEKIQRTSSYVKGGHNIKDENSVEMKTYIEKFINGELGE